MDRLDSENSEITERRLLAAQHIMDDRLNRIDRPPRESPPAEDPSNQRVLVGAPFSTFRTEYALMAASIRKKEEAGHISINGVSRLDRYFATDPTRNRLDRSPAPFRYVFCALIERVSTRIILRARMWIAQDLIGFIQELKPSCGICRGVPVGMEFLSLRFKRFLDLVDWS